MKNDQYDKKIFRLLYILNKLNAGTPLKTIELADEFKVTQRTVQRDLDLLNTAGFPLVYDETGHRFMDGFSLQKIAVSAEERFLLNLFYQLFSKAGTPFDSVAKEFINKTLLVSKKADGSANDKITPKQREVLKGELKQLSKSLGAKLEDLSYPAIYRKKIDEYLGEIENKINNLRKKKRVDIKFKRTGTYEQPKPVATIAVPKNYFKDPYAKLDFCEKEKDRIFDISFLLPNKLFRTFRTVLKTELFFKFWGSHIKAKKLTCFDKFAAYLGFTIEDKEFNYNASYGNDKGILITRASISWCEDIPMPKEEIKPFLNKTGGLWVVSDKHHK